MMYVAHRQDAIRKKPSFISQQYKVCLHIKHKKAQHWLICGLTSNTLRIMVISTIFTDELRIYASTCLKYNDVMMYNLQSQILLFGAEGIFRSTI